MIGDEAKHERKKAVYRQLYPILVDKDWVFIEPPDGTYPCRALYSDGWRDIYVELPRLSDSMLVALELAELAESKPEYRLAVVDTVVERGINPYNHEGSWEPLMDTYAEGQDSLLDKNYRRVVKMEGEHA